MSLNPGVQRINQYCSAVAQVPEDAPPHRQLLQLAALQHHFLEDV